MTLFEKAIRPRRGDTRTIADHEWEPPPTPGELGRWFDTAWPKR